MEYDLRHWGKELNEAQVDDLFKTITAGFEYLDLDKQLDILLGASNVLMRSKSLSQIGKFVDVFCQYGLDTKYALEGANQFIEDEVIAQSVMHPNYWTSLTAILYGECLYNAVLSRGCEYKNETPLNKRLKFHLRYEDLIVKTNREKVEERYIEIDVKSSIRTFENTIPVLSQTESVDAINKYLLVLKSKKVQIPDNNAIKSAIELLQFKKDQYNTSYKITSGSLKETKHPKYVYVGILFAQGFIKKNPQESSFYFKEECFNKISDLDEYLWREEVFKLIDGKDYSTHQYLECTLNNHGLKNFTTKRVLREKTRKYAESIGVEVIESFKM